MSTRYTEDHEYVRADGNIGTVGISNYAQEQLGDIVFVELPAIGTSFSKGDEIAVVESVKAASEIYAPVSGKIVEINERLVDEPGLINADAGGDGWLVRIELSDTGELENLMNETAYADFAS